MPPAPAPAPAPALSLLRQPGQIVMGAGQRHALPSLLPESAGVIFVCTDTRMSAEDDFRRIVWGLQESGRTVRVFDQVPTELPVGAVIDAVMDRAGERVDLVMGVGGGSCLDFAKVAALLLTHGGKPQDYYGEFAVPGPTIPVVAVPTTAGTGSEATPVAVLSDPDRDMKVGISSPFLIPALAVCDPELTYGAPPALTASVGADALSHLVESFTAIVRPATATLATERVFVGKGALTDAYGLLGLAAIGRSFRVAVTSEDPVARADMAIAALAGGLALGTAGTAAAHALQYPIGTATHTAHGMGVGCLLPYVMEFNRSARVTEFAAIARTLGDDGSAFDDEELSYRAVDLVADLLADVGVPTDLAALGMEPGRERWIAEQAFQAKRLVDNNPRALDVDALELIAGAAQRGERSLLRV
ncbi:iron-containing alcohol dehydrogenase [Modestobacter lapidis]|nr:iron-containing alcohol dehydrogenase [Modestobacter lapidis]